MTTLNSRMASPSLFGTRENSQTSLPFHSLLTIKYVDWQLKLNEIGDVAQGIDDINQCIAIILTTQKGSVPHRPTFGSDILKYIDSPIHVAIPNIIRETYDAIEIWEKRIKVEKVSAEIVETNVRIKIEWALKNSKTTGYTEVNL